MITKSVGPSLRAITSLRRQWRTAVSIIPAVPRPLRRVDPVAVVRFTRMLAVMGEAQVPIVRSLRVISQQQDDPVFQGILHQVMLTVSSGNYLSVALAQHPHVFSPIVVNMVRMGETVGNFPAMAHRLADYLERDLEMARRARAALVYPAFVTAFSLLTAFILFRWVVPPLLAACIALTPTASGLPWPTRALVALVDGGADPRVLAPLLGLLLIVLHGVGRYFRTPRGQVQGARLLLRIPVIGQLYYKLVLSHFCRALGILLASGLRLQSTFNILLEFVPNPYFVQTTLKPMVEDLMRGGILYRLLRHYKFPPLVYHLSYIGEMSGSLPDALTQASMVYDTDVYRSLDMFLQLIEPMLVGCMGLVVGFIVLAVFLPLYSVMNQL